MINEKMVNDECRNGKLKMTNGQMKKWRMGE
jgi:hypothetical protein